MTSMLLFLITSCGEQEVKEQKEVSKLVKLFSIDLTNKKVFDFPGEVSASREADIAFRVSGQIDKYAVRSGQRVLKGQLLANLDPEDYSLTLNQRQASYDLALVAHNRSETLVKDFLVSKEDFDKSLSELEVAEALLTTAKRNLAYTKVYAPYDGIIAVKYHKAHEYVNAQKPVLSIQSINAIDVEIAVPERLISSLRHFSEQAIKNEIIVSFPATETGQHLAHFKSISTVADSDTGSYEVTITLEKPKGVLLYSGMSAETKIELSLTETNLNNAIPQSAIMVEQNQYFVWKYNPDTQRVTKVNVTFDDQRNLLAGLNDSDLIVVSGVSEIKENQLVRQWNKERGL